MTTRIIFAGSGGQGIQFSGKQMAKTGMYMDKNVTFLPSYGPEMRGGTSNCTVVIADEEIGSPSVSSPDILVVMNKPSFDKFEPKTAPGGTIFCDSTLIDKKSERNDIKSTFPRRSWLKKTTSKASRMLLFSVIFLRKPEFSPMMTLSIISYQASQKQNPR